MLCFNFCTQLLLAAFKSAALIKGVPSIRNVTSRIAISVPPVLETCALSFSSFMPLFAISHFEIGTVACTVYSPTVRMVRLPIPFSLK